MSETPLDAPEPDQGSDASAPPASRPWLEADEADAAEQATDVPIDEDEYR